MAKIQGIGFKSWALASAAIVSVALPAEAQEATQQFNIAPQSLASALNEFGRQSGRDILFSTSVAAGKQSPGVQGAHTPEAALRALLAGTGLEFRATNTRTFLVEAPGALPTQLGDADFAAPSEEEVIVVTGTNIRGANPTAPVTVLDRDYIDSTGYGTTTALIESLPQNFARASQSSVQVPGISGSSVQGSAIDLRGTGEGTTLVLLNGRRLPLGFVGSAVDISALPLAAVERVEVLTDGASAIYGSDAVGGVVNFILRSDFEGAETHVRAGFTEGGVNEYRADQTFGRAWGTGSMLASLGYQSRDLLRAADRDFVPSTSLIGSLLPEDENLSFMLNGRQNLTPDVSLFGHALYTHRNSYNEGGRTSFSESNRLENPQYEATLGVDWSLGAGWQIEASGSYASNELERVGVSTLGGAGDFLADSDFNLGALQVKADGPLFALPGGDVRVALGADYRYESFEYTQGYASGAASSSGDADQTVSSAFVEARVPIIGAGNAQSWAQRLDLSLAGRYDSYSSFGEAFSPEVGVMWSPAEGYRLRARYGESFRAPRLADYNLSANAAVALWLPDPGAPPVSHQLQIVGADVGGFTAEESTSWSFGFEAAPPSLDGLKVSLNYFNINYDNQIAQPPTWSVILANPDSFDSLFIRNPPVAQVNEYIALGQLGQGFFAFDPFFLPDPAFDPSTIDVIIDTRRRNMSSIETSGLDLSANYSFALGGGNAALGLTGTYVFERLQKLTPTSASFDSVNTFYNPPHLRLRGSASWGRDALSANLFVNYTDSYTDNRATPFVSVEANITADARIAYDFGDDLTIALSAINLFDRDPPEARIVNPGADMGFDPTNASPQGRLIAIDITKRW